MQIEEVGSPSKESARRYHLSSPVVREYCVVLAFLKTCSTTCNNNNSNNKKKKKKKKKNYNNNNNYYYYYYYFYI